MAQRSSQKAVGRRVVEMLPFPAFIEMAQQLLLEEMKAIQRRATELECARQKVEKREREISDEEAELKAQRSALRFEETPNERSASLTWEEFSRIPESPVGSLSVESMQSAGRREETPSEDSTAQNLTPSAIGGNLADGLNWDQYDPNDLFSDPRCLLPNRGEVGLEVDVTAAVAVEPCRDSNVADQVMEIMKQFYEKVNAADRKLAQDYLHSKPDPERNPDTWTQYRFPLTEYEEWKKIVGLWGEELLCGMLDLIPDQKDQTLERPFVDLNRLVSDPEVELLQDCEVRPWSPEEIQIFLERFMEYPKDFYQIAEGLPFRSTGECVQFFYANKKSDIFGSIRRKHQLKKRRLQSESNREAVNSQLLTSTKSDSLPERKTEAQSQHELKAWVMDRLDLTEITFTEDQLTTAVQKFGFNYKALAKEVGSSKASVVGGYLLCHWRRFGLAEYFQPPKRPALLLSNTMVTQGLDLHRTISAPDRLTQVMDGYRETRAGTRYSHLLSSSLVDGMGEGREKKTRNFPGLEVVPEVPDGLNVLQRDDALFPPSEAQDALGHVQTTRQFTVSEIAPCGNVHCAAIPPMRFQPTKAYVLERGAGHPPSEIVSQTVNKSHPTAHPTRSPS